MRVLYVQRTIKNVRWRERVGDVFLGPALKGQDGFFEAALWTAFPAMKQVSLKQAFQMRGRLDQEYDWLVLNNKSGPDGKGVRPDTVSWIRSLRRCRKALFINKAQETLLADPDVLDLVDVVFKRELLKDLDRYPVAPSVRQKLHTTMLSCPIVTVRRERFRPLSVRGPAREGGPEIAPARDVFFAGSDSNPIRRSVLEALSRAGCDLAGGLYAQNGTPLDWGGPRCARSRVNEYILSTRRSRVNLAIDGLGGFTFRHLELWCLGAFMLSSPAIREIRLPGEDPVEGVHFACFNGPDDVVDKVRFFVEHDAERKRVAAAGRRFFEAVYDIPRHARFVSDVLARNR